jgi:hypothetical protein
VIGTRFHEVLAIGTQFYYTCFYNARFHNTRFHYTRFHFTLLVYLLVGIGLTLRITTFAMDQLKQVSKQERSQPQPQRCFWCFDQPQEPYFQPPHYFQSAYWSFQDTLRRKLVLEQQGKLYFPNESKPIRFAPGQPRQELVYSRLVEMDSIEFHYRRPAIADLGMAGSTVKQRKETPRVAEMLGLTAGRDWLTKVWGSLRCDSKVRLGSASQLEGELTFPWGRDECGRDYLLPWLRARDRFRVYNTRFQTSLNTSFLLLELSSIPCYNNTLRT